MLRGGHDSCSNPSAEKHSYLNSELSQSARLKTASERIVLARVLVGGGVDTLFSLSIQRPWRERERKRGRERERK